MCNGGSARYPGAENRGIDPGYDLIDDFGLIVSSFQEQYGIRLSKEMDTMQWDEFCDLLSGINPDTVLGRMVAIRLEENEDILENFTPEQQRIRDNWRKKTHRDVASMSQEEIKKVLENWEKSLMM